MLQKLTKYKVLNKLGEGAHAEVMLAIKMKNGVSKQGDNKVAIKGLSKKDLEKKKGAVK